MSWLKKFYDWLTFRRFFIAGLAASCLFTLTGFWGRAHWFIDLTSHFRLQYLAVQLAAVFWFAWRSRHSLRRLPKRKLFAVALCAGLNFSVILPYYTEPPLSLHRNQRIVGRLRLMHMNVLRLNHNVDAVMDAVADKEPDVATFQEVDEQFWYSQLREAGLFKEYPYSVFDPASENMIISRWPLDGVRVIPVPEGDISRIVGRAQGAIFTARLQVQQGPGATVHLITTHPPVPLSPHFAASYEIYIQKLAELRHMMTGPVVLVGDLNTTPWSAFWRRLLAATGLRDARMGYGIRPTWPAYFPLLFIPIDHVLVSEDFIVLDQSTGPYIGSDHLPLTIELAISGDGR